MKIIGLILFCFAFSGCALHTSDRAKRNEQYLKEQLSNHPNIVRTVHDSRAIIEKLSSMQTSDEVCQWTPEDGIGSSPVHYGEEGISWLKKGHLIRIALMLERIKGEKFTRRIGALIETDLADVNQNTVVSAEIAGFGLLPKHGIELLPIPSLYALQLNDEKLVYDEGWYENREDFLEDTNGSHTMPGWAYRHIPSIFHFHIHAVPGYMEYERCGPAFTSLSLIFGGMDDVVHALINARDDGEYHSFVFSSFGDKRYSIHYLGAGLDSDGKLFAVIVNLPTQDYGTD